MPTPQADLICPHCNRPMHRVHTPDGTPVDSCLPCKAIWLRGDPKRTAPKAEASIPIPFTCPVCVDPILTELRYRTDREDLKVEYCRSCHGVWMEQARLAAWRTVLEPPPAPKPVKTVKPDELFELSADLGVDVDRPRSKLGLVLVAVAAVVVVAFLLAGRGEKKPASPGQPPPRVERAREEKGGRGTTGIGEAPLAVPPTLPAANRAWSFTPTPAERMRDSPYDLEPLEGEGEEREPEEPGESEQPAEPEEKSLE
jgi:Zn-finger nucleic acid-binding protein